jgi:precorrin-8X/cobalt-precorrin-8 methylmutase
MEPMEIEKKSMEIIQSELPFPLPEEIAPIIKRVIHATADFGFAESLRFTPGSVPKMREMLQRGALVVTDTNMALAGINKAAAEKLGVKIVCFMALEAVANEAAARRVTRARVSMERALKLPGPKLIVCGNAPSFLTPLLECGMTEDVAVVGTPVGFVNVVEAKEKLWLSGLPAIVAMGRRGGSNVAAAIVNALMYGIEGVRSCGS